MRRRADDRHFRRSRPSAERDGKKRGRGNRGLGRSRGGLTTKIDALVDKKGGGSAMASKATMAFCATRRASPGADLRQRRRESAGADLVRATGRSHHPLDVPSPWAFRCAPFSACGSRIACHLIASEPSNDPTTQIRRVRKRRSLGRKLRTNDPQIEHGEKAVPTKNPVRALFRPGT